MKYVVIMVLFFTMVTLYKVPVEASYMHYERFDIMGGEKLVDIDSKTLDEVYKKVHKRRMFGWQIHEIHKRLPVTYIKQTLFSYYNDGFTPIKYSYQALYETSQTFQINATGSIGLDMKDDAKAYKNRLDAALKLTADYKKTTTNKFTVDIKIDVDPKTQVDLYIYGEGVLTNGVAALYFFFLRSHIGGYEIFESTTEYQRLEKIRI